MKAVVFEAVGRVGIADVVAPRIQAPGDAIVRVTASAICGSDLHFVHGKAPMSPGESIGHEGFGIVEETGSAVARVRPGDRVAIAFGVVCGTCWFCSRGETSMCGEFRMVGGGAAAGGLGGTQAERVRVPYADTNLLPIPADVDDERALFVGDVLTTAYYGAAVAGIRPGDTVAVVGVGPVGFFCVQAAPLFGAERVVAVDLEAERLRLAEKFGALGVDPALEDPKEAVRELTEGRGADVVIEAVGTTAAFETATRVVRRGGVVCVVGMYVDETAEISLGHWWLRGLRLQFAGVCPVHAWWSRALDAVRDGAIDPLPLVSHRLPLDEAPRGYELFASRQATKVVLVP